MKSETIHYQDDNYPLIGEFIYGNTKESKAKTIILFSAFEGRGQFSLDYANRLAQEGFHVFVADVYGQAKVATSLEECFSLITPFLEDRALVRKRAILAYEAIENHPAVDKKHIGAIGFCFGGMVLLELARAGKALWAGVCAHSNLSRSNLPSETIKTKFLILHGYEDPQVPPTWLTEFTNEMQEAKVADWTFVFFAHAKHSFTDPATGSFDAEAEKARGREYSAIAAHRSFEYARMFFKE